MLMAQHLIGFGVGGGREVDFLGSDTAVGVLSNDFTFADAPFGQPSATRRILVLVCGSHEDGNETIIGGTIGGVLATVLVEVADIGISVGASAGALIANVPIGTSGEIVIGYDANVNNDEALIAIYRLDGFNSYVPFDTASDIDPQISLSIDIPGGGAVFSCASIGGTSTVTISGVSQDFDDDSFSAPRAIVAIGGHSANLPAETGRSISTANGSGIDAAGIAVSFG